MKLIPINILSAVIFPFVFSGAGARTSLANGEAAGLAELSIFMVRSQWFLAYTC